MPRGSVGVGPVRVGSGCCLVVVGAIAILGLLIAVPIALATNKQYVLKHPKHEHCRAHYVKKTKKIKKHQETLCIYVLLAAPSATPAPVSPALAASSPIVLPISTPASETSATKVSDPTKEPIKEETKKEPIKEKPPEKPAEQLRTITTLEQTSQECSEEIKKRLMSYAKVSRCKHIVIANVTNQDGTTPTYRIIWFVFPDEAGFPNYEFEAELKHQYDITVSLEKELGIGGEVMSESCAVEIDTNLYFVRETGDCSHLPITAVYSETEYPSQSEPLFLEA
jgi:hypothetical protein